MKLLISVTAIMLLSFFVSCTNSAQTETSQEVVVFEDEDRGSVSSEVAFNDAPLNDAGQSAGSSVAALQPVTSKSADGSTLTVTNDNAGNRSESRCFDNNARIDCIVLKTSATGEKEVLVYAQNGQVKTLPEGKVENALTASADEIAGAAEIFESRNTDQISINFPKTTQNSAPLQPMPSYKFPVQKTMPAETQVEPEAQTTEEKSDSDAPANDGQNEDKREPESQS